MADFKMDSEGYLLDDDGKRQMLFGYPIKLVADAEEQKDAVIEALPADAVRTDTERN